MKYLLIITMIYVIIIQVVTTPPSYNAPNSFITGQNKLIRATPLSSSFSHSFSRAIVAGATLKRGIIGIVGFDIEASQKLQFRIQYNPSGSSITYSLFISPNNTINWLVINYLLAYNNWIDIFIDRVEKIIPQNLSKGVGRRYERVESIGFIPYGQVYTLPFLNGFNVSSNTSNINSLVLQSHKIHDRKHVQTMISADFDNIVTFVHFELMVVGRQNNGLNEMRILFTDSGYSILLNNATNGRAIDFGIQMEKYTTPNNQNRMFFGITGFIIRNDVTRIFNFNTSQYHNFDNYYLSNQGIIQIKFSYVMFAIRDCNGLYYDVTSKECVLSTTCTNNGLVLQNTYKWCGPCHYSCLTCSSPRYDGCLSCNASNLRYIVGLNNTCICMNGYVEVNNYTICTICQTYVPRCHICRQIQYQIKCFNCILPYKHGQNYICQCPADGQYFVSNKICVNTSGCQDYVQLNSTYGKCISCNTTLNYQQSVNQDYQCQCQYGFKKVGIDCIKKCGDGIKDQDQECDDGNLKNEDGCSDTCLVELFWSCSGSPSVCTSSPTPPTITMLYISRNTYANQMRLAIKVVPSNMSLSSDVLKSLISHNIPTQSFSVSQNNGNVIIDFNYNQTIDSQQFELNFTPSLTFPTNLGTLKFKARSINSMLTYDSFTHHVYPLSIVVIILDCLALLILLISIKSERMIGVEMIQTLQSVGFMLSLLREYPNSVAPLFNLRYSNGYNVYAATDQARLYSTKVNLFPLAIEKEFLLSFNVMYAIAIFVILIALLLKAYVKVQQIYSEKYQTNTEIVYEQMKVIRRYANLYEFIVNRVLFVVLFLVMFSVLFAFSAQMQDHETYHHFVVNQQFNLIASFFALLLTVTFVAMLVFNYVYDIEMFNFKGIKLKYIVFYVIYEFAFIVFVSVSDLVYGQYTLIAAIVLNMVTLFKLKPYSKVKLHNCSIIYNQSIVLISVFLCLFIALQSQNRQAITLIGCYAITIMLYLCVIITTYRLYQWKPTNEVSKQHQQSKNITKYEMIQITAKPSFVSQQLSVKNLKQRYINKSLFGKQKYKEVKKQSQVIKQEGTLQLRKQCHHQL